MALLSAEGISKRFGGVVALDDAAFACEAGEIHALLGGNGAGKSTLVKILCGVQPKDAGTITIRDEPVSFSGPAAAAAAGIVPVFQELSLVPDLTVAENLFMGWEPRRFGFMDGGKMRRMTREHLASLGFHAIDPAATVRDLPLAERQLVEIAKAIVFISHRMEEILSLCDRATVFRDGRHVGIFYFKQKTAYEIVRMMVGR